MDQAVITIGGYGLSHLELWGTVLYLSVGLARRARQHLDVADRQRRRRAVRVLFWRIRLYADLAEQGYFFVAGCYGWWACVAGGGGAAGATAAPIGTVGGQRGHARDHRRRQRAGTGAAPRPPLAAVSFPEPAAYPVLDAATTVMSFVAMIMMAWRRVECWYLWIAVDVVASACTPQRKSICWPGLRAVPRARRQGVRHWQALARGVRKGIHVRMTCTDVPDGHCVGAGLPSPDGASG